MATVTISAPWVVYYRKVEALFKEDPGVNVLYDEEQTELKLYVNDAAKASALTQLLPEEMTFGNVTLKIVVIPGNNAKARSTDLYTDAFQGNNAVAYIKPVHGVFQNTIYYIVFKKTVVQFFTDDLSDIHGIHSTLYQDIAREIFNEHEGIFFCTDVDDSDTLGSFLGLKFGPEYWTCKSSVGVNS